jgi:membrane protein
VGRVGAVARRFRRRLPPWLRGATETGHDVLLFASGLAFYGLVSAVPAAILVMWLVSLIVGEDRVQHLARTLASVAPPQVGVDRALIRVAQLGNSLGIAALVSSVWPASAYGAGLGRAFQELSPKAGRPRLEGLRGRGLILVGVFPVLIVGSLAGSLAATGAFAEGWLRVVGWVLALVAAFVGAAASVAVIYRIFPPQRLPWSGILRGTIVTGVGIALLSLAFAVAIGLGADFETHYALSGLVGIVLLGVWLFLSNAVLLVGYRVAVGR